MKIKFNNEHIFLQTFFFSFYVRVGCQSAKHGMSVNITCQQNTGIKIEDAWMSWKTTCPAYNNTHHHHPSLNMISRMCDLKQTCKLTNIGFRIMSIYFSCEGKCVKHLVIKMLKSDIRFMLAIICVINCSVDHLRCKFSEQGILREYHWNNRTKNRFNFEISLKH